MANVVYRGKVAELDGTSWEVPESVIAAKQAASWIESQHREEQAKESARIEAERRQQELLAARLEEQRAKANTQLEVPAATREELKAELAGELDQLSQSVMAAGAAIAGRGEAEAAARAEWESRHEQLLAQQEQTAAAAAEQVVAAQATTQAGHEQIQSELADLRDRNAELERELRAVVSTLVGPKGDKGDRGMPGQGFGYVDADPTRIEQGSLGQKFSGRPVVPGDNLLQRTPDSLKVWRTADGKTWTQIDEIVNKQELVSQPISVLDQSTKQTISIVQAGSGGGGGGGERLLINRANVGATSAVIADASNWAGISDPLSGELMLDLRALDGSAAGQTGFLLASFNWDAAGGDVTEFSLMGGLEAAVDVELSVSRSPASAPSGVTVTIPPGASSTQVWMRLLPKSGAAGAVNRVSVAGSVEWSHPPLEQARDISTGAPKPLWLWV